MKNNQITLTSPGKLNLFLHINGKRDDGYHELQSIFQFFDFGDEMQFTWHNTQQCKPNSPLVKLDCDIPELQSSNNLVFQAANKLAEYSAYKKNLTIELLPLVTIKLIKHLPTGGGIGGGSSNAATTLLALNKIWQIGLSIDELADIGLSLGADVPVFVRGYCAFANGVGEQLLPFNAPEKWYLIAHPNCHISTATVFGHPDLPRNTPKITANDIAVSTLKNDCEALVKKLYPEVAITLSWLLEYAPAKMTGTGACCFAEFDDKTSAEKALINKPDFVNCFVAKGLNKSPVLAALGYTI
ncbi:4-(cytidine 5'-diphospho)-2-C-methyl-D-erythritol kinase [Flocculibacter collagenilyticus]|uniref:4-(cytidine 5'-diphospho)-2-C-methyl-D-erythritol kinase n=1 Tax=Flocculibacter collagenilyticus TaxID=2744479 RepID=UPI001F419128|nr:4-(cytidine 5'-diphospho)-2-C-methyl-D-erythritol kinase [Flocculibacter collagenilyticus]